MLSDQPVSSSRADRPLAVVVMAAGLGTRMKSDIPKVLHPICGRPLLAYVLDAATSLAPARLVVVTGPGRDGVEAALPEAAERAVQAERLGSGDAVRAGMTPLDDFEGDVMVLNGDVPLVTGELLAGLRRHHVDCTARATITSVVLPDPLHYGRVLRDAEGNVTGVVEARDASPEELAVREINVGFYVFDAGKLRRLLPTLTADNAQGEFYITDLVQRFLEAGDRVAAFLTADVEAGLGVNSRVELAEMNAVMRRRLLERLMLDGVTVEDPSSTYVDWGVTVGRDSLIRPQTMLTGATSIGERCSVGPGCFLEDVSVDDDASIVSSHLVQCRVGPRCTVGPFAFVRPRTELAEAAKAGSFVEIKASKVGKGSKVPHLSYIGDTTIGEGTNIGAGTITANYDGERKHPTTIGDNVKVGSDTVFVAPVEVGSDVYTGAGSIITRDIPDGALGVARARQDNIEGYSALRRARRRDGGEPSGTIGGRT
jgi:bifunctional UDP-N-acetylglucosamine pyrophosphorylase / glucosamine-1-phosphate N-acetyltransferase